jgi:hypothetical protein
VEPIVGNPRQEKHWRKEFGSLQEKRMKNRQGLATTLIVCLSLSLEMQLPYVP